MADLRIWGDFEVDLEQVLGKGGMGIVYRGRQVSVDRPVAVKVLQDEIAGSLDFLNRFKQEAKLVARLIDGHVVQVFGAGEAEGRHFYVMEFVEGEDLASAMRSGRRFTAQELLRIAVQAGQALQAAWGLKIVHRDIKPSNLILTKDNVIKVTDFGLAKRTDLDLTRSGIISGTVHYISPEQASGGHIDIRSDLYSLGCSLYELAVGQPPFQGDSAAAVIYQHVHQDPRPPRELDPSLPEALEGLILRCIQKRPQDRYAAPEELVAEANRILAGGTGTAIADRMTRALQPGPTAKPGRGKVMAAAGLLLLAGGWFFARERLASKPAPPPSPMLPPIAPPPAPSPLPEPPATVPAFPVPAPSGPDPEQFHMERRSEADKSRRVRRWLEAAEAYDAAAGALPVEDPRRAETTGEAQRCRFQEAQERGEDGIGRDDLPQAQAAYAEALRLAPGKDQREEAEKMGRFCERLSEASEAFRRDDWVLAEILYKGLLDGPPAFRGRIEARLDVVQAQRKRQEDARLAEQESQRQERRAEEERRSQQTQLAERESREKQERRAEEERRSRQAEEERRLVVEQARARSFEEALLNGRALFARALQAQSDATAGAPEAWERARAHLEDASQKGLLPEKDQALLGHARAAAGAPPGMLYVPAGLFRFGSGTADQVTGPEQEVRLEAFYISQREVTKAEYKAFLDAGVDHSRCHQDEPKEKKGRGGHVPDRWTPSAQDPNTPVTGLDWFDAYAYAAWKGARLPTEQEWEKAAGTCPRTGERTVYPWGDAFRENLEGLSASGCQGMVNGVLEWVEDWYGAYPGGAARSPEFGRTRRSVRGGNRLLDDPMESAKLTTRFRASPEKRDPRIGFRIAKDAE
jgi:formylglycine-generating enzyme required for sulfatase activity/predicted Ser/Thr protein kinase